MKIYPTKDIRNVGIVGHGGTGKTQLVSSLLFTAGATQRFGKVAEGTTTTDWDEEEIARKISIQPGLAHAEWPCTLCAGNTVKINFLDLPGYSTFITETKAALVAADAALITVDAHVGSSGHHGKSLGLLRRVRHPARLCPHLDGPGAFQFRALHGIPGGTFWPQCRGAADADRLRKVFRGVVDLVAMKAHRDTPDGDGKASIENIPDALIDEAKEAHEKLVEMIAEGDDEMMEEFFREGTIPVQDLIPAVRKAIVAEKIVPVLMISSTRNIGNASLLTFLADVFPHPDEHAQVGFKEPAGKGDRIGASTTTPSLFPCSFSRRLPIPSPAASTISRSRAVSSKTTPRFSILIAVFPSVFSTPWSFRGNSSRKFKSFTPAISAPSPN